MKDAGRPGGVYGPIERSSVRDVDRFEIGLVGKACSASAGEIVDHDDLDGVGKQRVDEMASDETGSSGH
jgi:hypothetical protein